MILLLVIGDYLRHHKPEDLGPEIRSKIADIANSIPLLLAVICTIVALAGFVTAVIWYNSQTLVRGPSSLLALPATAADPPPYDGFVSPLAQLPKSSCAVTPFFGWTTLLLVCLFNVLAILLGTYMFNYVVCYERSLQ